MRPSQRRAEVLAHPVGAVGRYTRIVRLPLLATATLALAILLAGESLVAQASRESKGWVTLFDGRSMDHWNDPSKLTPPGDAWTIEDGCLKAKPNPTITEDLVSTEAFADFELDWQWKISEGGNAGVKYRVQAFPIITAEQKAADPTFENKVAAALKKRSIQPLADRPRCARTDLSRRLRISDDR